MSQLHLTKVEKLQLRMVREVFTPWGLATAVEVRGKHLSLKIWDRDGRIHRMTIACTPRCGENAAEISQQRARRLLRQINAEAGY